MPVAKTRFVLLLVLSHFATPSFIPIATSDDAPPKRPDKTLTAELLDQLRVLNEGKECYTLSWLETLKQIVDVGPEAVPELIAELDATDNERMLRCLGFTLRAIDDKRAVPALIRAIPKTLNRGASGMGLTADDPDLLRFAQQYELPSAFPRSDQNRYHVGGPVTEIFGALHKLTGQEFDEEELYGIHIGGFPHQQRLKREFFQRTANKWAAWWGQHWSEFLADKTYSNINLAAERDEEDEDESLIFEQPLRTGSSSTNGIFESAFNLAAKRVFLDFDSGRRARLPEKWRNAGDLEAKFDEIRTWAIEEGFDVMGTEYVSPADGRRVYAIRSLGMQVWELGKERWKVKFPSITIDELKEEGRPAGEWLLHINPETQMLEPLETATFFFLTRHNTPGLLFVGVEVQDDSLKTGDRFDPNGDLELRPISFFKGRRYGNSEFRLAR